MIALALIAGLACVVGSYHLGYAHGLGQAAKMTEDSINMVLDCLQREAVDDGK